MKFYLKIISLLAVFIFSISLVQAYCPPYFAKIDSVENGKDCLSIKATGGCGGEVEVINHCSGEFYFYDQNGNLNEKIIMINSEEWNQNYQKYQQLEEETGKDYWGHQYLHQPGFDEYDDCVSCPNDFPYCDYDERIENELIIDGINVCDKENLDDKTTVKYWTIKIFSKEDNQDVVITGRTVYKKPVDLGKGFLYVSILSFIISGILLFAKYGLKKKIYISLPVILIIFGIFLFFLYFMSLVIIG